MIATRQDIRRAAGNLICCGFEGTTLTAEVREVLREARPSGVILFKRNLESPIHAAELVAELKHHRAREPLFASIDQEGGRVARLGPPLTVWPPMGTVGQLDDPTLCEQIGRALAAELRAVHIDVNFAPVLDVHTHADNPVIGDRAFGSTPEAVARLGVGLIRGLQAGGVAPCGKHFPGHGDTDLDSHTHLPRVPHDTDRLRAIEWPPFKAAIDAGLDAVMTAHVIVEGLDPDTPATLSPQALAPLRTTLGFQGVVISDDIEMKALADHHRLDAIAVDGLNAGIDLFLACHRPETVLGLYRAIVQGAEREEISARRLLEAEQRVVRWRHRYYRPPSATLDIEALTAGTAVREEIDRRLTERGLSNAS